MVETVEVVGGEGAIDGDGQIVDVVVGVLHVNH